MMSGCSHPFTELIILWKIHHMLGRGSLWLYVPCSRCRQPLQSTAALDFARIRFYDGLWWIRFQWFGVVSHSSVHQISPFPGFHALLLRLPRHATTPRLCTTPSASTPLLYLCCIAARLPHLKGNYTQSYPACGLREAGNDMDGPFVCYR